MNYALLFLVNLLIYVLLHGKTPGSFRTKEVVPHYFRRETQPLSSQQPPKQKAKPRATPTPVKQVNSKKTLAELVAEGIDPVCQMTVPKGTQLVAAFGQKQYGLCSEICHKRFTASPTTFVKP